MLRTVRCTEKLLAGVDSLFLRFVNLKLQIQNVSISGSSMLRFNDLKLMPMSVTGRLSFL